MRGSADAIVLGGNVEGLVCAGLLARAGRSVVLVEERANLGGALARREFCPGYHLPDVFPDLAMTRASALSALELEREGLAWREVPRGFSPGVGSDVRGLARLDAWIARLRPILTGVLEAAPPEVREPSFAELAGLARRAVELRRLGERDLHELLRVLPAPAWDWIPEYIADPVTQAALVAPALSGTVLGPRAPGTAGILLLREAARGPEPVGGGGALVDALVARARSLGVELRVSSPVGRILLEAGRVRGLELEGSEVLVAPVVASAAGLKHTVMNWIEPRMVPAALERAARDWRVRGSTAVLSLALSRPPRTQEGRELEHERFVTARSLLELERAADAQKYARFPDEPWLDVRHASHGDSSLAPPGCTVLQVFVHGVPRALAGGFTEAQCRALRARILAALERSLPGLATSIVGDELCTPADLEERFGLDGGHLHQGEIALDQLWLQRPSLELSRARTPLAGLFLCGGDVHPGGPFLGGAGALAAAAIASSSSS